MSTFFLCIYADYSYMTAKLQAIVSKINPLPSAQHHASVTRRAGATPTAARGNYD